MKWIHTSDLHIGKQINEFSLLEDQRFFLRQLSELALKERPDVLLFPVIYTIVLYHQLKQ